MKESSHFDRVEAYLENKMNQAERRQFETDLSTNTQLREEYDAYRAAMVSLELLGEKELSSSKTSKIIVLGNYRKWAAAAILIFGLLTCFWFANRNYSNSPLISQFYEVPIIDQIERSADAQGALNPAWISFGRGNFAKAVEQFEANIGEKTADDWYYLSHAYFNIAQYEQAIKAFQEIVPGANLKLRQEVEWFSVLANLQLEKEQDAFQQLSNIIQNDTHPYLMQAKALKEKLESKWRWLVW